MYSYLPNYGECPCGNPLLDDEAAHNYDPEDRHGPKLCHDCKEAEAAHLDGGTGDRLTLTPACRFCGEPLDEGTVCPVCVGKAFEMEVEAA